MVKKQIEVDDVLQECVDSAIDSVKEELDRYVRSSWRDRSELPDMSNDLNYSGAIHQIIDGAVPIYTNQIETAWFLYSNELEEAYENAGIGSNSRENNGMAAIYCYIEEKVNEWWHNEAESEFNVIWAKLRLEQLKERSELLTEYDKRWHTYREGEFIWHEAKLYYVNLASYGDYDNSCQVERANYRVFEEKNWQWLETIHGGYSWSAIAVNSHELTLQDIPADEWIEFIEMVDSLSDYPALDDEEVSGCENEAENEAWESWLEQDVRSELEKLGISEEQLDKIDSSKLFGLTRESMEEKNAYFEHESGGNVYLDTDAIIEALKTRVESHLTSDINVTIIEEQNNDQ